MRISNVIICLSALFCNYLNAAEDNSLQPMTDAEIIKNSEPGIACTTFIKDKTYLYDYMDSAIIKVSGKIIHLKVNPQSSGGPYYSNDGKIRITHSKNGNLNYYYDNVKTVLKSKHQCGD